MDIKTLYPLVTDAVRHAELLEESDPAQADQAYLTVSLPEEQIADLLPATHQEGAIARRGAIGAAMTAHHFERAQELAIRFMAEGGLSRDLGADLARLKAQAQEMADHGSAEPTFLRPGP